MVGQRDWTASDINRVHGSVTAGALTSAK